MSDLRCGFTVGTIEGGEPMRTIKRYLGRALADPGSAASVIVGVVVGAFLGGHYEARSPTHTAPARRDGVYKGVRDD